MRIISFNRSSMGCDTDIMPPAVSVCMPMRNASRYLRECIDSVLAQTFTDFEFLIADDGSTDCSVEIVESYSDPRIRLIKREHDFIASLNCLLDSARGKYIARMDADDIMLPHRLKVQYEYMESHPSVSVLGCGVISFNEELNFSESPISAQAVTLRQLVDGNRVNHPTAFIRRSLLAGLKYEHGYIYAEDYRLWSEVAKRGGEIRVSETPVIRYRIYPEQVSSVHAKEQQQTAKLIQEQNRTFAAKAANPNYSFPKIAPTTRKLTVIIPFLNEGEEVVNTVASVREFAKDAVDIFVINDFSYDGIDYGEKLAKYEVYYFVNFEHKGVAASRDWGVSICKTPYFLLLDAHMRFYESGCIDTICRMLEEDDRRLLCCQSVPLIQGNNNLIPQSDYKYAYGAYIPFDKSSLWPDIRWNNYEAESNSDIEEISVVLGAGYAASVIYWDYLKGLQGLRGYGFDEVYISSKVWMDGGKCILLKKHILGHLYRNESPYFTYNSDLTFNSLLISSLLLPRNYRNWSYSIALHKNYDDAVAAIGQIRNDDELMSLRAYYLSHFSNSYDNFIFQNMKSQSLFYLGIGNKLNDIISEYLFWLKTNYSKLGIGLRNGGLSSALLLMSLHAIASDSETQIYLKKVINDIEATLLNKALDSSFEDGVCGIGWVIIGLHRYGLISELPTSLLNHIDNQINKSDFCRLDLKDFNKGIGGILCYTCARLYASDHIDNIAEFLNPDTLLLLRNLSTMVLSTPGCDSRTYYHALEYLDAISTELDDYIWTPKLDDVVFCSEKPILNIANGGYDLFSGVMRNWAFAIIHNIKTNQ